MRVLLLSPYPERISPTIENEGDTPYYLHNPEYTPDWKRYDFGVSYGHRYLIKPLPSIPLINLHISFLPWNRGADPNLWSWIDNTPKGVTIHQIDEGIDTGPILYQCPVTILTETLATTYAELQAILEARFAFYWKTIRQGLIPGRPQSRGGTYHSTKDRARVEHLLTSGWNTPVSQLIGATT